MLIKGRLDIGSDADGTLTEPGMPDTEPSAGVAIEGKLVDGMFADGRLIELRLRLAGGKRVVNITAGRNIVDSVLGGSTLTIDKLADGWLIELTLAAKDLVEIGLSDGRPSELLETTGRVTGLAVTVGVLDGITAGVLMGTMASGGI